MVLGLRWRRDAWLIGSLVLAVLIVGAASMYGSVYGSGRPDAAAPGSPRSSSPGAEPLPRRGVGAALLVYACERNCPPVVRLADGREFQVRTDAASVRDLTLSPDGRWLGHPAGTGYVLRDLMGTGEHRLDAGTPGTTPAPWAWSADSTMLLVADLRDGLPVGFVVLFPADGRRTPVTSWPGHDLLGVRKPFDLLSIRPGTASAARVDVDLTVETGATTTSFTVDATAHLRPGERIEPSSIRFTALPGYEAVVVRSGDDQPVAVLRFPGGGGTAMDRFEVTESGPGTWTVLGVGEAGRAFVRSGRDRTTVWYLGADGVFGSADELPGAVSVITPGTARG